MTLLCLNYITNSLSIPPFDLGNRRIFGVLVDELLEGLIIKIIVDSFLSNSKSVNQQLFHHDSNKSQIQLPHFIAKRPQTL